MQRDYLLKLLVNGRTLSHVRIDDHYEIRHSDTVNDALILEMVKTLNGRNYLPDKVNAEGWEFYRTDPLYLGDKVYRLVWCLHPDEPYIGVINAFRR